MRGKCCCKQEEEEEGEEEEVRLHVLKKKDQISINLIEQVLVVFIHFTVTYIAAQFETHCCCLCCFNVTHMLLFFPAHILRLF